MKDELEQQLKNLYKDLREVNLKDVPKELGNEPTPKEVRDLDRGITTYYNKILDIEDRLKKILEEIDNSKDVT